MIAKFYDEFDNLSFAPAVKTWSCLIKHKDLKKTVVVTIRDFTAAGVSGQVGYDFNVSHDNKDYLDLISKTGYILMLNNGVDSKEWKFELKFTDGSDTGA